MNALLFEALAEPTRLRLVEVLQPGEKTVNELVEEVSVQQSGVSRHLRILEAAGVVRVRPEGTRRLYSLRPERFKELDLWLEKYRSLWEARLDRFEAALEKRKTTRSRKDKP